MSFIIPQKELKKYIKSTVISIFTSSVLLLLLWFFAPGTIFSGIPIAILSVLCGSFAGVIQEFIFFILSILTGNINNSYILFILLVSSLLIEIPLRHGWFKSPSKLIIFILVESLITGIAGAGVISVYDLTDFTHVRVLCEFLNHLPISSVACLFGYIFYNFTPEKIQSIFLGGIYYKGILPSSRIIAIENKSTKYKLADTMAKIIIGGSFFLSFVAVYFVMIITGNQLFEMNLPSIFKIDAFIISKTLGFTCIRLFLTLLNFSIPVAMFANAFIKLQVTKPISLMSIAMENFTNSIVGNNNQKTDKSKSCLCINNLEINTKNEISDLYKSLKITASTLTEYINRIQREKELEEEIKIANAANKAKSVFLSNMSHEIRTPINAVLGMDEMILREGHEEQILGYAQNIKIAGKTLLSLINDILDFSKIESGKMQIILSEYDLSSTINDLCNMISSRAKEKGLDFIVHVNPKIPYLLLGDETRIKQCIINILTNAVKYTPRGKVTMTIGFKEVDKENILLTARVEDTGIGIKEEDIPKLFHAFERIEEERNRSIEGTGLGMNIVQRLLAMMDSHLEVKSRYGQGSDFYFEVQQKIIDTRPIGNYMETYEGSVKKNTYRESFTAAEAKVLVVDDTKMNLTVFTGLLKQTLMQIDTSLSGEEALNLCKKKNYDIIFIDHRMPGMDGLETLAEIKKLGSTCPTVALTANAIAGARETYLEAGFTDYLTKPIDEIKLEQLLIKYLPQNLVKVTKISDESLEKDKDFMEQVKKISGIDYEAALKNCDNAEVLKNASEDFYNSIDEKAEKILGYVKAGDIKNFTILVHALKSSARLIGANLLSSDAAFLEQCGDKNNKEEIEIRTPSLIEFLRSYKFRLAPLFTQKEEAEKKEISEADFTQVLGQLLDCARVFDFDTADAIVKMLADYKIPSAKQEDFVAIKKALAAVDQVKLVKLLEAAV